MQKKLRPNLRVFLNCKKRSLKPSKLSLLVTPDQKLIKTAENKTETVENESETVKGNTEERVVTEGIFDDDDGGNDIWDDKGGNSLFDTDTPKKETVDDIDDIYVHCQLDQIISART